MMLYLFKFSPASCLLRHDARSARGWRQAAVPTSTQHYTSSAALGGRLPLQPLQATCLSAPGTSAVTAGPSPPWSQPRQPLQRRGRSGSTRGGRLLAPAPPDVTPSQRQQWTSPVALSATGRRSGSEPDPWRASHHPGHHLGGGKGGSDPRLTRDGRPPAGSTRPPAPVHPPPKGGDAPRRSAPPDSTRAVRSRDPAGDSVDHLGPAQGGRRFGTGWVGAGGGPSNGPPARGSPGANTNTSGRGPRPGSSRSRSPASRFPRETDGGGPGVGVDSRAGSPRPLSYSQRVTRLRKPALTAADKLGLEPEERARIYRLLRTPRRPAALPRGFGRRGPAGAGREPGPGPRSGSRVGSLPLPLRVYCYGIDDVRLYRALAEADAVGLVVVVPDVDSCAAVWATRTKRTGKALTLTEVANAARNACKPFTELTAVSSVRVMEAVEALTGWPVPAHLRPRGPPGLVFLPPLEGDPNGSAEAFRALSGGLPLPQYLLVRAGLDIPAALLRELDRTDLYDSRDALLPVNPQEREAHRQRPLVRPYMTRSRIARQQLLREQMRRRAEAEGSVPW